MDANSIWANNDYAYFERKGRGEEYRPNAERVRVVRLVFRTEPGNTRESTFVMVRKLDDDGTPKPVRQVYNRETYRYEDGPDIVEVKARDIAELWDHYVQERNDRESATRAREANAERERQIQQDIRDQYKRDVAACIPGVIIDRIRIDWNTIAIDKIEIDRLIRERKDKEREEAGNNGEWTGTGVRTDEPQVVEPASIDSTNDETGEVEDVSDYMRNIISGNF